MKTVEYKIMWELAKKMMAAFEEGGWKVGFVKEKKRYDKQRLVLEFLVKNRRQGAISAIREHYRDKIEIADGEGGVDTMYFLDQREVVHHFFRKWAGQEDLVTVNDKLCVVGLVTLECNRDRTVVFINNYTKNSEVLDNPVSVFIFIFMDVCYVHLY